jgi:hypothetical protein
MVFVAPLITLVALSTLSALTRAATVQNSPLQLPASAAQNRQTVRDMFVYSYDAYKSVFTHGTVVAQLLTVTAGRMRWATMT